MFSAGATETDHLTIQKVMVLWRSGSTLSTHLGSNDDQYVFDILHTAVENRITIPSKDGMGTEQAEIVKIKGNIKTDAIHRIIKTFSTYGDLLDIDDHDKIQRAEKVLYDKGIGVSIEGIDSRYSCAATLSPEYLWIDEERAFVNDKKYTVFGRVSDTFASGEQWDYLDIVKTADTIIADETMEELRTMANNIIETVGGASEEFDRPAISPDEMGTFSQLERMEEISRTVSTTFELSIDEKEIAIEGPGVEIEPVAVYW